MNRIYQGRVTNVELLKSGRAEPLSNWQDVLWQHHQLFQDAVNYYIVALASLGSSPQSKLTRLRELLGSVWEGFDKKGQRRCGMGESLQRAWQLSELPTLVDAVDRFRNPLLRNGVKEIEMELAGESLAYDLGGEGSIQQGGIEYWPYFCQSGFKRGVTFPREAAQLAKEKALLQIPRLIWNSKATAHVLRINGALEQFHFCNISGSGKTLSENRTKEVFRVALTALEKARFITSTQRQKFEAALETKCPAVSEYAGGSINKDVLKHRFYGFLVFKHLSPNREGLDVLRSIYEQPRLSQKRNQLPRQDENKRRLLSLGEDPIKLVRTKAGIVFRAFTALPRWRCEPASDELHERSEYAHEISATVRHQVSWKEFDIAAFKEALKVYNQFQQNVEKREEKLNGFALKLLVMDGERVAESYSNESNLEQGIRVRLEKLWRDTKGKPKLPANQAGEDVTIPRFSGDPRIERLRKIVNDELAEEYRLTDGIRTAYGLRRRTMKGWGEVKRRWQQIVKPGDTFSKDRCIKLKIILDELRGGEKREQIGSHRLFEALIADEDAWRIWREPDTSLEEKINRFEWAPDPLDAFREYCEIRESLEEISGRPLSFTPADARYSRRLFIFTEVCSFGKDRGEFRHDAKALAVTVPLAFRGSDGRMSMQPCRLMYSAPRLLRDRIRTDDGIYVQDWTQPMMRALFGESDDRVNPQELKDAAVQLMPDYDSKGERRILLNFPLKLDETRILDRVGKASLWAQQFVPWKKGAQFPFLRWGNEFDGKEPHRWWEKVSRFHVLGADLGTRHAASIALVECSTAPHGCSRHIGTADRQDWFARFRTGAILRLPGENAAVLRPESPLDSDGLGKAFREELYGERGRPTDEAECEETFAMLSVLNQSELLKGVPNVESLKQRFSLPEQNDKLLVAFRRTQNWIATCVSWHWKLTQPDTAQQRQSALEQIREQERVPEWRDLANGAESQFKQLRDALHRHICEHRLRVQEQLLRLTLRILPLRGRIWEWVSHPEKPDCHLLRQTLEGTGSKKVKLRGQRGLSMARIEQLSELRRRWQSLNQSLRRKLGDRPLTASEMRNDPIPDPCPDILVKLENIREQRVNQTAHLILAQALGLRLRHPQISEESRRVADIHGEYEVVRPPVDIIVVEDLARYLSDQGRAKSENTRLMKWCHRAITLKLKMLAEPFGLPVLETPAAYSSRFCSLSGMPGFRASEVGWNDRDEFRWRVLLEEEAKARAENKTPSPNAAYAVSLFTSLKKIAASDQPNRTLLAPQPGGPIFVTAMPLPHPAPAANRKQAGNKSILPMQADLNAAVNLALRAVAHPATAHIHHRLRTERKKGAKGQADTFLAREPRRFGKDKVPIRIREGDSLPKERNPNLFYDEFGVAPFGRARLETDAEGSFAYASGPGIWKTVNDREKQWKRCEDINNERLRRWLKLEGTEDDIPM